MYLHNLTIDGLKLLKKGFHLDFTDGAGEPRMWTVIIGENGTGKTSVLQAIAMAAVGGRHINGLVTNVSSLRDKRMPDAPMSIKAEFGLSAAQRDHRFYPGHPQGSPPPGEVRVESSVILPPGQQDLIATSRYLDPAAPNVDPIIEARAQDAKLWFVAAYGINRALPERPDEKPILVRPSKERLEPVFQPRRLIGTAFINLMTEDKARMYSRILNRALFKVKELLPGFKHLELSGRGGVKSGVDLQERHRFVQDLPSGELRLAANWLSHGYQSTIAWIADLVGHIIYEAAMDKDLDPEHMEGLVLIDEIDLYLHPRWQMTLIRALRETFPRIQFVATTHSPLALTGLRTDRDEIVRLVIDKSGSVDQMDMRRAGGREPDPRLMTGTEIYRSYFGVEELYPAQAGALLREHRYLAADPCRSDGDEKRLDQIEANLRGEGIEPDFPREARRAS